MLSHEPKIVFMKIIVIAGNAYSVKEELKALGAHWSPDAKAWMISEDKADEAREIVANRKPPKARTPDYIRGGGYRRTLK